jgi:hypothetical protein
MREALEELESMLSTWVDHLPPVVQDEAREAIEKANSVLDEPLRNCDVGTTEEQMERHYIFCSRNTKCHPDTSICMMCYANWSQKPYKEVKNA